MKTTGYFKAIRHRPDRAMIRDEWLEQAQTAPLRQVVQADGRIRCWVWVPLAGGRYLRVVFLPDGITVHNAFLDRRFKP